MHPDVDDLVTERSLAVGYFVWSEVLTGWYFRTSVQLPGAPTAPANLYVTALSA